MKKIIVVCMLFAFILTACNATSIGIIGGADGPTAILVSGENERVKGQFGEQYEKRPIRMFNIDGELYFDSGLISDATPRCGMLDGSLQKGVGEGEIPKKNGEANFDTKGYQSATSITKEVIIDGEWVIFKKYEYQPENLEDFKYCFYIKGHLNNAAIDSEIVVLTDDKDITFSQVYEPLLSSQRPICEGVPFVSHNPVTSGDEWGLTLYADDVTNSGMTVKFMQFGGSPSGELKTGEWFELEKIAFDNWQAVDTNPLIDYAWNSVAYNIKPNDITELKVEWKWLYGELPAGSYRLSKKVMDYRAPGDFDEKVYKVYFTIE